MTSSTEHTREQSFAASAWQNEPTGYSGSPSGAGQRRPSRRHRRWSALTVAVIGAVGIAGFLGTLVFLAAAGLPGIAHGQQTGSAFLPGTPEPGATGAIDLRDPVSPFDDSHPAVIGLAPELRDAIRAAATDAEADGVSLELTSGWRSADYQATLYADAIDDYGSEHAAREFVSTPEASRHVTGDAIDIARVDPALWLEQFGSAYGLCRVFANESWHFELATTPGGECPVMLADASEAQ